MNKSLFFDVEKGLLKIGDEILSWQSQDKFREVLEPTAFKTYADKQAHSLLVSLLNDSFKNTIVLSEEDISHDLERPESYWLIDPIDGTSSWYHGYDGFVTQIAYIENNIPTYGAVYSPAHKKIWTAIKNNGAFLNGTLLQKLKATDRLILIDNYPEPRSIAMKVANNIEISSYLECGSLGLKSCMVADGTADVFIKDVVVRDWDIAPAIVIINEVGGVLRDLNGENIKLTGSFDNNTGLIVARDISLMEKITNLV